MQPLPGKHNFLLIPVIRTKWTVLKVAVNQEKQPLLGSEEVNSTTEVTGALLSGKVHGVTAVERNGS